MNEAFWVLVATVAFAIFCVWWMGHDYGRTIVELEDEIEELNVENEKLFNALNDAWTEADDWEVKYRSALSKNEGPKGTGDPAANSEPGATLDPDNIVYGCPTWVEPRRSVAAVQYPDLAPCNRKDKR
jgi:hypothetical protein